MTKYYIKNVSTGIDDYFITENETPTYWGRIDTTSAFVYTEFPTPVFAEDAEEVSEEDFFEATEARVGSHTPHHP